MNTTINGCEEADLVLLIGTNPRYEAPILNARLRKGWIHNELDVGVLGPAVDLSYDYEHLGDSTEALQKLGDGTHPFAKKLAAAKRPAVIVGSEMLHRPDAAAVMANVQKLAQNVRVQSGCGSSWRVLNVLHKVAGQVSSIQDTFLQRKLHCPKSCILLQVFQKENIRQINTRQKTRKTLRFDEIFLKHLKKVMFK